MTTNATIVFIAATMSHDHLPANRLAVAPAVFSRLCRESGIGEMGAPDELHITTDTDDAADLDALDDMLRDRAQTVGEFVGSECVALFVGQGIDGCDVWARCRVEEVAEDVTAA